MNINECKQALREKGVNVENISEETVRFLCDSFEVVDLGPPPNIDSLDPAERVKAGMQQLEKYIAENDRPKVFDLISDAIEMVSPNPKPRAEEPNNESTT